MVAHLPIAAFGMRRFLRVHGAADGSSDTTAALGGALFAFSGYFVTLLAGNGVYAFGAAWVPWVLAAGAGASSAATARQLAGVAARTALLLALCLSAGDP